MTVAIDPRDARGMPMQRDLKATLDGLVAVAVGAVRADAAAIYLRDAEHGDLALAAALGLPPAAMGHRVGLGEGLVGRVAAEGKSLLSEDVSVDPRAVRRRPDWDGGGERRPVRSFLGLPLRAGTLVIGALELTTFRPGAFELADRAHAAVLADAAALLIEQTRLIAQAPPAALAGESLPTGDPIGVATLDGELRITSGSPTFCRLVGQPIEALIGRPVITVLPALGRPRARDALAAALHGAPGHLSGISTTGEAGKPDTLSVSLIPIGPATAVGGSGRGGLGILMAVQDIAERARLEAELRAQHARALAARDGLRAVIEVVSHELRTPLTSVLGYAHLLVDRPDAPAERREHWAQLVMEKARMMARQVDEVTELARLGSARFTLNRDWVDLAALIRHLVEGQSVTSERHTFELDLPAALPPIWLDRDRMEQVVTNLLTNAVKFWPEGGSIALRVIPPVLPAESGWTSGRSPRAGEVPKILVEVQDGGPGVPAELAEHIFEPFYRVQDASRPVVAGTGLGLAVSRGIVEAHGGRIWYEPAPGGGSLFRFTLPVSGGVEGGEEDPGGAKSTTIQT